MPFVEHLLFAPLCTSNTHKENPISKNNEHKRKTKRRLGKAIAVAFSFVRNNNNNNAEQLQELKKEVLLVLMLLYVPTYSVVLERSVL
jgi:hypothetical protein